MQHAMTIDEWASADGQPLGETITAVRNELALAIRDGRAFTRMREAGRTITRPQGIPFWGDFFSYERSIELAGLAVATGLRDMQRGLADGRLYVVEGKCKALLAVCCDGALPSTCRSYLKAERGQAADWPAAQWATIHGGFADVAYQGPQDEEDSLRILLDHWPLDGRACALMHAYGYPQRETAELLGVSPATVSRRLARRLSLDT